MNTRVIVITGVMASGKSTVAQLLTERYDSAAHIRGDVFRRMVVSGRVEPDPQAGAEADMQLRLRYRLAAQAADGYAAAGFTGVLQDVVMGEHLLELANSIRTRPLSVVALAPNVEAIQRRERDRPKTGYDDAAWTVRRLDDTLRATTPRIGLWLDTSEQTPEETVDEILQRLPESELD